MRRIPEDSMRNVLLVDDDVELCELLREYLTAESFEVDCVHDGQAGVDRAREGGIDVMVLDVMMPRLSGFDALQRIRATSDVPVLMLTARGDDVDRIVGLEMGADDYLPKPCNPRELVARIRAILRRTAAQAAGVPGAPGTPTELGDLRLDPARQTASLGGEPLNLTGAEFKILEALTASPGTVLSKERLTEIALARKPAPYDRSIDVHVSRIRKKLGDHSDGSPRIKAVRGAGYLYTKPPATSGSTGTDDG
jgi:two-component system response regulator CpxR